MQLHGADIDRDVRAVRARVETLGLGARLAQDPASDRHDQTGLLGEHDEAARIDAPPGRVLPTHERLDALHRARVDLDDRLVVEEELVAVEGVGQVGAQLEALEHLLAHAGPVDLPTRLAVVLGRVHGDVGVAEQRLDGVVRVEPNAMPIDALEWAVEFGPSTTGLESSASSRSAISSAASAGSPSTRIANSSPPSRATESARRTTERRRTPTSCSMRSPAAWPRLSLTVLKSSRSMHSTAVRVGCRRRCEPAPGGHARCTGRGCRAPSTDRAWRRARAGRGSSPAARPRLRGAATTSRNSTIVPPSSGTSSRSIPAEARGGDRRAAPPASSRRARRHAPTSDRGTARIDTGVGQLTDPLVDDQRRDRDVARPPQRVDGMADGVRVVGGEVGVPEVGRQQRRPSRPAASTTAPTARAASPAGRPSRSAAGRSPG